MIRSFFVFIWTTLIITSQILPPKEGAVDPLFPDNELNIQVENVPTGLTVTFELKPIGQNWAQDINYNFIVTNDNSTQSSSLTVSASDSGNIVCANNGFEYRFAYEGNHTLVSGCAQSTAGLKPLRNGFYKMSIKVYGELKTFVYFDWRDTGFTNGCNNNDMTIRYDYDLETLKFWNDNSIDEDNQNYLMLLEDEQIITWSDYNCSERNFTTFWSEGLVIISKKNSSTSVNEPMLIWGPYDGFQPSGYKIYWRTGGFGNFSLLATTNAHTYSFVHEGFTFEA